jgi:preprotein translocase subunit YajC
LLIVGIILFMYLFVIRPQSRAAKLHREFLASLTSGVDVVTSGGLIGTVEEVQDSLIRIRLDGGNVVRVLKSAVSSKWDPSSQKK